MGAASEAALDLLRGAELIDLHVDTFILMRSLGWDPAKRHRPGLFRGRFFGHLDEPRARAGGLTGAMWSITTNPFRSAAKRWAVFQANLQLIRGRLSSPPFAIARTLSEYRAARASGAHACLLSIQGGNALEAAPEGPRSIPDKLITRVTLVHLLSSAFGVTSTPVPSSRDRGLTALGKQMVEQLDAERILVDLAHIHPKSFWDAVAVHDRSLPLIVTHTGVSGVTPHWRNIDDDQIRAIADSGGTIGIIFSKSFLSRRGGPRDGRMVVEHMKHVIRVAGDDFVSIGSDFDGAIVPPPDLRSAEEYPVLVQHMLDEGIGERSIRKILGENALRVLGGIRP